MCWRTIFQGNRSGVSGLCFKEKTMAFRTWLFIAGVTALLAIAAAAYGAHALSQTTLFPTAAKIYDTAQLFHMLHAAAIFGIATLFAATEGRRAFWASLMLQIAAFSFLAGIGLFSGGIYYHVLKGVEPSVPIVPAGGASFMVGWGALALSAFGFRRQ
jgi:uncharacterized membrane protein YgdD (TMEM256/DUF423 family)